MLQRMSAVQVAGAERLPPSSTAITWNVLTIPGVP
jgi:hypothetical protein